MDIDSEYIADNDNPISQMFSILSNSNNYTPVRYGNVFLDVYGNNPTKRNQIKATFEHNGYPLE